MTAAVAKETKVSLIITANAYQTPCAGHIPSTIHVLTPKVLVAQSCPTLCDSMDYGPPVHGILQARILVWVAIPFTRGYSQLRDQISFTEADS